MFKYLLPILLNLSFLYYVAVFEIKVSNFTLFVSFTLY